MSDEERQQEVNGDSNQEAMDIIQGIPDPLKQGLSEEPNTEVVKPNDNSNEEVWLIKDKFRNDDNGRDALTKAYRELQSEKDKISGEIKKQATELQPLRQMDEFLKENPKIVEKLAAEVEREQKGLQSPPKPEDYDVYDESVEGTSSYKWRQAQDEYLVRRGADRAVQELNKFKLDVARQEQIRKEDELLKTEFKLNREDIESYRSFLSSPDNVNHRNAIELWKMSNGNSNPNPPEQKPQQEAKPKQVSAAAVSGSSPRPAKAADKVVETVFNGIMGFNRK